ncbi:MAG TPA: GNAT family N-acetyltransferase [Vicinamibacterales bacterium]|nr:GNAT family N-acetyltransferase [Vicinamibacterales bacterium]
MTAGATSGIRLLDWDSEFFGFPIARIEPDSVVAGVAWCLERGVRCAYLLADADDSPTLQAAAAAGFRAVDVRVTLTAVRAPRQPAGGGARPAVAADIPSLTAIARHAHTDSRFYADGGFDRARCDDLFATWIEQSCLGWADHVVVYDDGRGAAGYVTVHDRAGRGEIGLVAVHERARGRGAGRAMIAVARAWCELRRLSPITVVTQGGNRAALAFYQTNGFDVTALQIWYHRWFPQP